MARPVARVEGKDRLIRRIRSIAAGMKRGGDSGASESAERIKDRARALAPVDTGKLRDSIKVEKVATGKYEVGPGDEVDYALFVELGTSRTRAQPYMRPAIEAERAQFVRNVRGSVTSEIR